MLDSLIRHFANLTWTCSRCGTSNPDNASTCGTCHANW
jgi:ribosomal protein L40E